MLLAVITSRNTNSISSGNNKMRDENDSWWVRMIRDWQHFRFLSSFMQMFVANDFRGLNKHRRYVLNPSLFQPQMLIFPTSQFLPDEANFRFSAAFNTTPPSDRGFPYILDLWQRNFFPDIAGPILWDKCPKVKILPSQKKKTHELELCKRVGNGTRCLFKIELSY